MAFRIPNDTVALVNVATNTLQASIDAGDIDILVAGFQQTGVLTGCNVTVSTGTMNVTVTAGTAQIQGGSTITVAGATVAIPNNATASYRFDLIYADSGGVARRLGGVATGGATSSPEPCFAALPVDGSNRVNVVVLAAVLVPPGVAALPTGSVIDKRVILVAPAGGSGGATWSTSIVTGITQTAHGFVNGNVLRLSGSTYVKAKADTVANAEAVGIVAGVIDANNFQLMQVGYIAGLTGLAAGTAYYLSATTAGAITSTAPSTPGQIVKPIIVADGTTTGYVLNYRGSVVPSSGGVTFARQAVTMTSASLANNARDLNSVGMAKTWMLAKVVVDRACRIRLYTSVVAQIADATRPAFTAPSGDAGCVFDLVTSATMLTWHAVPNVTGTNDDGTPTSVIPITIDNLSGATSTVTVTITYFALEI